MGNFNEINTLKFWCQKVLPLVYDDSLSYYEVLGKVVKKLNDLIENNAKLPDYIKDLIESYITSGAIGDVVRDILTNFMLNVKNPPKGLTPAVGDGSKDDTEAIQGCIDYANTKNGMFVYFPSGAYLCQPLSMKTGVSLGGLDRYSTRLVMKGGATKPFISGNADNVSITKMTIDGNMDIQVNDVDLIDLKGKNYMFSELLLNDGYNMLVLDLKGGITQISDVVIKKGVVDGISIIGNGDININNVLVDGLSALNGRYALDLHVDGAMVTNFVSNAKVVSALNIASNNNYIVARILPTSSYVNSGTNNNIEIVGLSKLVNVKSIDETSTVKNVNSVNYNEVVKQKTVTANETITSNSKKEVINTDMLIVNSDNYEERVTNKNTTVTENVYESVLGNSTELVTGEKNIESEELVLNPTNPLTYKAPTIVNENFKSVPMKSTTGEVYKVLVEKQDSAFANVYLQTEEPTTNVNHNTLWYEVNGTANFGDGVSIGNAETGNDVPESPYWFDPIEGEE